MSARRFFEACSDILSVAIALEASAYPKPGNVHRLHDYPDKRFEDFIVASIVSRKYFARAMWRGYRLGVQGYKTLFCDIVREAVYEVMSVNEGRNTSLGTILLFTPIALSIGRITREHKLVDVEVLAYKASSIIKEYSTVNDSIEYYRVLRRIKPSYLRKTDDTGEYPNIYDRDYKKKLIDRNIRLWNLLEYASRKDVVSRQLVTGYKDCLSALEFLEERLGAHRDWNRGVVETYLYMLSRHSDTIVVLKHGIHVMEYVRSRAKQVLKHCIDNSGNCTREVEKLDNELYTRRINPGSIADMTACVIMFKKLRDFMEARV